MASWEWQDLCGRGQNFSGWTDGDFSRCFEELVVLCPPHVLLALVCAYFGASNRRSDTADVVPWFIKTKSACAMVLTCLSVMEPVLAASLSPPRTLSVMDGVTQALVASSWLLNFIFLWRLKYMFWLGYRGPIPVFIAFLLTLAARIVQTRSVVHRRLNRGPSGGGGSLVEECSVYTALALQCLYLCLYIPSRDRCPGGIRPSMPTNYDPSETEPLVRNRTQRYGGIDAESEETVAGEDGSNCLSKLTFCWAQPMMVKGSKGNIRAVSDLYQLPKRLNTRTIQRSFKRVLSGSHLSQHSECLNGDPYFDADVLIKDRHSLSSETPTLLRTLHKTWGTEYYLFGLLKLMADSIAFSGPILLNLLVSFIENRKEKESNGILYATGLLVGTLLGSLCTTQFNYHIQIIGFKIRAAIVTTIYEKTLFASPVSFSKFSTGEIVNFMSTDADRIVNFCPSFHSLWSLPFQIMISLYLLYQQVGLAFLAGLAFAILLIPVNRWIAVKIGKLSKEMMKQKDGRVKVMNEILYGMRVVKYYAWEKHFYEKINILREAELKSLKGRKYLDALCVYFWATTPVLISILTFTTYVLMGHKLTAAKVFTSLSLFVMLISPLNAFPWVVNGLMEAWVSLKRVQAYIEVKDMDMDKYYSKVIDSTDKTCIHIKDGQFTWQEQDDDESSSVYGTNMKQADETEQPHKTLRLTDININIKKGQFVGIIGKVGSGKSSLLSAILGEMHKKQGTIAVTGLSSGFSLIGQEAWMQHATIKDNILFGRSYNARKYEGIINACALCEDLKILPARDSTEIGENGVTLSGGQKTRISLARAMYQDKDIYLLDDPLATVDTHVAQHLYQHCIKGILKHKTRILCTHHTKFLREVDLILVMNDGKIIKTGSPSEILSSLDSNLLDDIQNEKDEDEKHCNFSELETDTADGSLIKEETKETGILKFLVYKAYWKAVGFYLATAVLLALLFMQVSRNINDWWLSFWVSHSFHSTPAQTNSSTMHHSLFVQYSFFTHRYGEFTPFTKSEPSTNLTASEDNIKFYLMVYGCLAAANSVFTIFRAFLFAYGGIKAAQVLHNQLLSSILKAPIYFFEVTPIGRIVNRFSSDVYAIDDALPFMMNIMLAQFFGILGTLVVTCYGLPWFSILMVPLGYLYYLIQQYYRHTSRELKRIASVTLSPMYAHFSESICGLATIRALRQTDRFQEENLMKLDNSQRAKFAGRAAASWLGFRLQMIGVAMVTGVAFIAVIEHHFQAVSPGLVGLAITYALSITNFLNGVVTSFTETEKQMVSVERSQEYIDRVPHEQFEGIILPTPLWPTQGCITFKNVELQYRSGLTNALHKVTFKTRPSEKIGVVGRTGSGKSTLFLALFRIVEIKKGDILIDDINILHLDLQVLRSHLAIIPQDPFLFTGSVRENLDPTGSYPDSDLWMVLDRCHLKDVVEQLGGLDADVAERGWNFSVGQRQLVCLARALLTKSKILCMDEATASIDQQTDELIQQTIRVEFAESTLLTIAHRINTVLDSDRILVMDSGRIAEFASPKELLKNPDSLFCKLVQSNR